MDTFNIKNALISVFDKDGLAPLVKLLQKNGVSIYSTGGTAKFIEDLGIPVHAVEDLTGYPSIFGGRVKTLHPAVFGGILYRRNKEEDVLQAAEYKIPSFDLVVVDLYPFEETLKAGASHQDIIEKIDIGGVSLIRAAAKNYQSVCITCNKSDYAVVTKHIEQQTLSEDVRKMLASKAFGLTQQYDQLIGAYLNSGQIHSLRYGENPHQVAQFVGCYEHNFERIQGKEISYNNLLDIEAAIALMGDFETVENSTFAIIKHNNACGIANKKSVIDSYKAALSSDPLSAFGGIMICNKPIDAQTAAEIDSIFFEILIAPGFDQGALDLFAQKGQRTLLKLVSYDLPNKQSRTMLNGVLMQERDTLVEDEAMLAVATEKAPSKQEINDLLFAVKVVKHTKSNAIVLVKDNMMIASGTGQTSRVDALNQAIAKATHFGFDLNGAVMASDAFFPFPDCVEIGANAGITAIIQPGGSIKDKLSVEAANKLGVAMVVTGHRHFRH